MKILVINTVEFHINGISNMIMGLYKNINDNKINFDFIINNVIDNKYENVIKGKNDGVYILKNRNKNPFYYINKLSNIIKKNDYDIVHIHGNSALMSIELMAVKKSHTKAKVIVHAHNTDCTHRFLNKILYRYFIKNYDYAVACSKAAGEWLYKNNSKYTVLNNGIDENSFQYNPEIRNSNREKKCLADKFVITHIGRFNSQKNHEFLIDIFKVISERNKNAVLRLVGEGELKEKIITKVCENGLSDKVYFVGEIENPEIEYNIADVFVLPSLYESFGLVNVEAQCSGLPCVISDTVPKDIKIIENVVFLSLNESHEIWAETIMKYENIKRENHSDEVVSKGFSIKTNANILLEMYKKINENK
ncbi:MAG: glycosyltransferase [Oscillospiraceae bacterium]|nr:glycosyltransferase [Oscillospiraceae bacterium]